MKLPSIRSKSSSSTSARTKSKLNKFGHPSLPSAWKLFTTSLGQLRKNWWSFAKIILIVAIPVDILSAIKEIANDKTFGPYLSFGQIVMNVALIYAIAQTFESRKLPKVGRSYYDGSYILVRFILVTLCIVIMLFPALLGLLMAGLTFTPDTVIQASPQEQIIMIILGAIVALPSFYWITRNVLGLMAVAREDLAPLSALRAGRLLTRGYFWAVAGRLVSLVLFLAVVSVPISIITALLYGPAKQTQLALTLFQLGTSLTALPLFYLFGFNLYIELEDRFVDPKALADLPRVASKDLIVEERAAAQHPHPKRPIQLDDIAPEVKAETDDPAKTAADATTGDSARPDDSGTPEAPTTPAGAAA